MSLPERIVTLEMNLILKVSLNIYLYVYLFYVNVQLFYFELFYSFSSPESFYLTPTSHMILALNSVPAPSSLPAQHIFYIFISTFTERAYIHTKNNICKKGWSLFYKKVITALLTFIFNTQRNYFSRSKSIALDHSFH